MSIQTGVPKIGCVQHDCAECQARAALSAPAGWQPIETAPKDSRSRLVWCPARENIYVVCWDNYEKSWWHSGDGGRLLDEPTHWMPLPAAPSPQEQT